MPSKLLKTTTKTFSGIELTNYVNDARGTEYEVLSAAIIGAGISIVSAACGKKMSGVIATALGLTIGASTVVNAIIAGFDDSDLSSTIKKMDDDDKLKVTTKFYEWSSGSGNSYTYTTKVTYAIV